MVLRAIEDLLLHMYGAQPSPIRGGVCWRNIENPVGRNGGIWANQAKKPRFFANFSMRTNFGVLRPFSGLKHFVLKFSTLVEKCLSP